MSDLVQTGVAWLEKQRHAHMTQTVEYRRGADSVSIDATPGQTEFDELVEDQIVHRFESRDWSMRTADLVLDSITVTPVAGDLIIYTSGGFTRTYEVLAPSGEQPFRPDRYGTKLRIHTKLVDTEDA